jgi:hypothetical protein
MAAVDDASSEPSPPFSIKSYVDSEYGGVGVQCRGVSDSKLSVSLPKDFDDLSSLVYDLGDKFGATCDLKQTSEGAGLVVWYNSSQYAQQTKSSGLCAYVTIVGVCSALSAAAVFLLGGW